MESASPARAEEIERLGPWFHNLHLPDGTQTRPDHPLGDFPAHKWAEIAPHLPEDLSGKTVLDIGCNAGFYSFALAQRGATVLGIDREPLYLNQARWAAREFGMQDRVSFEERQIYELARDGRRFDVVLFMGVFYHLRYPELALDTVSRLRPEVLVFQSLSSGGEAVAENASGDVRETAELTAPGWPAMAFIETTFWKDPTNWWAPNHAAVVALLRTAGYRVTARPGREVYICAPEGEPYAVAHEAEWRAAVGAGS